ncbi:MAG TPA: pyridoxal-phosphate dependent enzyme [Tenuifilaceae bacterium]|nr:pyridoxal-phosphate dependent enzyme [Tenuifilaceae bacterium]
MQNSKYYLECTNCKRITPHFAQWFRQNQQCPECGSKHSEVWYSSDYGKLSALLAGNPESFWHYFDYLPLSDRKNIISCNEGAIPLERWGFLEEFTKKHYGLNCEVWVYRNDLNGGTGTFKDVAASLAASLFREEGIKHYIVASTGNTATSYSKYLALGGILCSVFIPDNALKASEAVISAFSQKVYRIKGDYARAKEVAAEFAKQNNILISSGNIDPIRVEAKKTMVFEWLRMMKKMPDVYIQAVSGGTGPIAIDKGVREIVNAFPQVKNPRMIMVQPDKCDPMVRAWENAERNNFPEGFEKDYPILKSPQTEVPTLATGHPATYPLIARLVRQTGGTFLRISENKLVDFARLVAFERKVLLGPASAVCMAGFFKALKEGKISNNETVLVNTGEGTNRAPDFLEQMIYTTDHVSGIEDCKPYDKQLIEKQLWKAVEG